MFGDQRDALDAGMAGAEDCARRKILRQRTVRPDAGSALAAILCID